MTDSLDAVRRCLQSPLHKLAQQNNSSIINPVSIAEESLQNSVYVCVCLQVFTGSLQCAAALMNVCLRTLSLAAEEGEERGEGEGSKPGKTDETGDKERVNLSLKVC